MQQIAMKFVQWDVPELEKLKDSRVYQLREQLDNGEKLSRENKNWITRNVKECIHFKRGIALMGYFFDFSDVLKRYFVKQHGHIAEYYAIDKTALRSVLYGRIEDIVEVELGHYYERLVCSNGQTVKEERKDSTIYKLSANEIHSIIGKVKNKSFFVSGVEQFGKLLTQVSDLDIEVEFIA